MKKTHPAPEAVLKTADKVGEIIDLKYSTFGKLILNIKIMYNEYKKKSIGKKINKRIKKIEKADKIGGGKGGCFARNLDNDYSVEDDIQPIPEERKEDEYTKLKKFFDDVNKSGIELNSKKEMMLKAEQEHKKMLSQEPKHKPKADDQNDRHIKYK
ncbi:hypothetical protein HGT73_06760 [Rosenbergiella australiborealis]|uniref:Uncharacterized protein n=1 Tax=Rosenbergiella australiborealis TaxID=1544696 RepID=A0ABS5T403_9GAMM|nr:hypothetical protein [Rosenbergiella australiborealis]MBT0727085.1 hypothetical protein [Rosenbergiella australiborealis]